MLILMLVIRMLILMLLNLNTGYADTDADLCIRMMSLCCKHNSWKLTSTNTYRVVASSMSMFPDNILREKWVRKSDRETVSQILGDEHYKSIMVCKNAFTVAWQWVSRKFSILSLSHNVMVTYLWVKNSCPAMVKIQHTIIRCFTVYLMKIKILVLFKFTIFTRMIFKYIFRIFLQFN